MKKISIVIPIFNEEDIVDELVFRIKKAISDLRYRFEIVVVDDGSSDGTLARLQSIRATTPQLKIVKLSRNWGHQNAFNAGLDNATGNAVVLMDGDLEDPPDVIREFINKWEEGFDVVTAVKESRHESQFKKLMFSLFYRLIKRFSNISMEKQIGMFSLIDEKVVKELRKCSEKNKYYVGLRAFVGFKQARIVYSRDRRYAGKPKQTYIKLINYALNAFFSFSFLPIRVMTYFGIFILLTTFLLSFILVTVRLFNLDFWVFRNLPGWTSIVILILFILSIQIIFMGFIGEYIARIFDEVRDRPYYIVESVLESNQNKGNV
jgi:polyisoprenyl-phosphate glycosyltransferase